MVNRLIEITEEEYRENLNKPRAEKNAFMESKIPVEIACGYGYYGGCLKEVDQKFYISATCGDSCD